ncbi:hypothetical protein AX17_005622, partial [Amanita inopinata Kibby_2008]
ESETNAGCRGHSTLAILPQPTTPTAQSCDVIPPIVASVLAGSLAPATRRRYDVSVQEFFRFCAAHQVPEAARFPASEMLLALFVSSLAGSMASASIQAKISALRAWHIQQNVVWQGGVLLQQVLKGARNATPDESKQSRRLPVTVEMLEELHQHLNLDLGHDIAVFAVAMISFYGQLRRGEVCADRED